MALLSLSLSFFTSEPKKTSIMVVVIKRNPKKVDSLILIERTTLKEGPHVRAVRCSRDLPVRISVVFIIQGVGEVVCRTSPPCDYMSHALQN